MQISFLQLVGASHGDAVSSPTFRALLAADQPALGTFVKIPAPEVVELVADAGFDFVVIDTEHALLSVREVYEMVVLYSRCGVTPLVRVTDHGYGDGQRYLDAGVAGLLVPHVSDGAQAAAVMSQFVFPPEGTRGMGSGSRAGQLAGGRAAYVEAGRKDVVRIAMIEEASAVADLDAILATDSVDAVFAGPGDLSMSMGVASGSPEVRDAIDGVIATAVAAGVPAGTVVSTSEQAAQRVAQGCRFVLVGSDLGIVSTAVRTTVSAARTAIATAREGAGQ